MQLPVTSLALCLLVYFSKTLAWIPPSSGPAGVKPTMSAARSVATSVSSLGSAPSPKALSTAIVGGGPSGLASALMLARRGYKNITVLERLQEPPVPSSSVWGDAERSYNLGIGGRGQVALAELGVMDRVRSWCADAVGRKDWSPQTPDGAERIFTERKYNTKVIQRDRLSSCLLEEIREKHKDAITVRFCVECMGVDWREAGGGTGAELTIHDTSLGEEYKVEADLVMGADGVKSAIRDSLESSPDLMKALSGKRLQVKRFQDNNQFVYRVVPFKLNKGWRIDFNYSHRTKKEITLETLPTKEGMHVGILLFRPGDQRVLGLKNAGDTKALFQELFPQFAEMVSDEAYERLAAQSSSRLPVFSYVGPVLHLGRSAVLLGDAIKSVKPYFGMGVNTAFEDCMALNDCLEETGDDLSKALPLFSQLRASEAKDLVELSRGFDRSGLASIFGFVVPLILDGISHKLAPTVFRPNTISFLQTQGVTFGHIRRRKWLDRAMQATLLTAGGRAVVLTTVFACRRVVLPLAVPIFAALMGR
ncbi:unnamed protein product [Choristocarpus tenellus]